MKIIIAIPAYNEEIILKGSVLKTVDFCQKNLDIEWQIVIADNQSTDKTGEIGKDLANQYQEVEYVYVEQKGKGTAIRIIWQKYLADIYCFMDADLATDLSALPELVKGFNQGYDMVIGSRAHSKSKVNRSLFRKIFSFGYRLVLKILLNLKIKDVPCGFKAINNKIREQILPQVKNNEWFFDSELLILAEKNGYKIKEIPVIWEDLREGEDKSKVPPLSLSLAYFREVLALRRRLRRESDKAIERST